MIGRTKMAVKILIYKTFDPIQSNPIQSMDESNPHPTLKSRNTRENYFSFLRLFTVIPCLNLGLIVSN